MNQSNLYSYSIITGAWNDLDYDVLLLVKQYLELHLNRRLLNKDYNVFFDRCLYQVSLREIPFWSQLHCLKVRYGLKNWNYSSYNDENGYNILFSLDYLRRYSRYYILGIELFLNDPNGCTEYVRKSFVGDFTEKYSPNGIPDDLSTLIQNKESLKAYVRVLMIAEDNGYNPELEF